MATKYATKKSTDAGKAETLNRKRIRAIKVTKPLPVADLARELRTREVF